MLLAWAAGLDPAPLTNLFSFKLCRDTEEMQHFLRRFSRADLLVRKSVISWHGCAILLSLSPCLPAFPLGLHAKCCACLGSVFSRDPLCNQNCRRGERRERPHDVEEVSEARTPHLEGSITRSLLTDGGWTLLDASVAKELLAVRPCPWHLPGA